MENGGQHTATGAPAAATGADPARIGPYRVVRPLGRGGMGTVYLAEQREPVHREVAIKVIHAGLDSYDVVKRFESERQALAVMDHPAITKVFDAGVTEGGLPYFVMERVEGAPIADYADAHRLSVRERVRLVVQLARAVQHAHQKGIIHRDIKPSNVLVSESDGEPHPRIIDFGIARAVEPPSGDEKLTLTGVAIGTPAYMSPEQAMGSGLDVDTRTDIYALGVLLYELLTGVMPYDTNAPNPLAMLARIATAEAPPPSTRFSSLEAATRQRIAELRRADPQALERELHGDLRWVVLKAMDRDRDRRYETANALALDLERWLADEPVSAMPPSTGYLVRKFVRRHRIGVTFGVVLFLTLAVSSAALAIQATRLARARTLAETRQGQAEDLIGFMLGDLRARLAPTQRLDVMDTLAAKALDYFAAVPEGELSGAEQYRRTQALRQIGDLRVEQGDLPAALVAYRQSLGLARDLASRDTTVGEWQVGLGASHFGVGFVHWRQGSLDSALTEFVPYLAIAERIVSLYPDSLPFRLELAYAHSNIGSIKEAKGDLAGALDEFRKTLAIKEDVLRRDTTNLDRRLDLAQTYNTVALAERKLGDLAGAERDMRAEGAIEAALVARDGENRPWARQRAVGHAYLGDLLVARGKIDEAVAQLDAARSSYATLVAVDAGNAEWRRSLANAERLLARARFEQGRAADAARLAGSATARIEGLLATKPDNRQWQRELVYARLTHARALAAMGRLPEARGEAARGVIAAGELSAKAPNDVNARQALAEAALADAEVREATNDREGARAGRDRALAAIDSVARATRHTDLIALSATALAESGSIDSARGLFVELARRGYRRPTFVALARRHRLAFD